jgi:undecaprenyl-diphosphatase
MDWLLAIDISLLRLINGTWIHPVLDHLFAFIAHASVLVAPLVLLGLALLIFGRFKERVFVLSLLLCLVIGDAGINWTIKRTANRPRPHQALEDVRRVRGTGFLDHTISWSVPNTPERGRSMPSGHMCNNTAAAVLLFLLYRPWGALAFGWAAMVGYSRIYTGDHYPSDILVSVVVAGAYTALICCAAARLWHNYGPRFAPQLYALHPRLYTS